MYMRVQKSRLKPREKLLQYGSQNLTEIELLQIILRTGGKAGVERVASTVYSIINKEGDDITVNKLSQIKNVGVIKAISILAAIELGLRLSSKDRFVSKQKVIVNSGQKAFDLVRWDFANVNKEIACALFLDARFGLIEKKIIGMGGKDQVSIELSDLIRIAIYVNGIHIILLHNHPSGDPTPSKEDISVTEVLKNGLDMFGMRLLDHIILTADGKWESVLPENGL